MARKPYIVKPQRRRERVNRDDLPIVEIERVTCPTCGWPNVKTNRSVTDPDGGVTRDTRCLNPECRQRFFVIVE